MRSKITTCLATAALALLAVPALADDWVAVKQRGTVLVLVDGAWEKLGRGDVVSDERIVRTVGGGRVTLQRGDEIIELGADTQVRIFDRAGRKFTTVVQDFGTVSVEAEVRDVQHFSVKTPQLAAVVKGTRFTVRSDAHSAEVEVERGRVAVRDTDTRQSTTVTAGQSVSTSDTTPLQVSGSGELPAVFGANGKAVIVASENKSTEHAAAKEARDAAKEAREAAKEAKEAAREAAKDAREGRSENSNSSNSGGGNSGGGNGGGNSGTDNSGGNGKKDKD